MAGVSFPETARLLTDAEILRMPLVFVTLGSVSYQAVLSSMAVNVPSIPTVLASKIIILVWGTLITCVQGTTLAVASVGVDFAVNLNGSAMRQLTARLLTSASLKTVPVQVWT